MSDGGEPIPYHYKERTERHRPHLHLPGAILFVTFRLADSIPQAVLREYQARKDWLKAQARRLQERGAAVTPAERATHEAHCREFYRLWFGKFEDALHARLSGPVWLEDEHVAKLVADALHWRDGQVFQLDAYCVMPNHVHTVFAPFLSEESLRVIEDAERLLYESDDPPLDVIMHSLKSWPARQANLALGRRGRFWEHESYDHMVRDEDEYHRIVNYVLNNPVKAGLVADWHDWPWCWKRE